MSNIVRASTSLLRVITKATGPDGVLLGYCDNFRCGKTMRTEMPTAVGSFIPVEALLHGEEGHFSWGQSFTFGQQELSALGVVPKKSDMATFTPFVMRAHDDATGKVIAHILDGIPGSADLTINAQSKIAANVSGSCRLVQFASELS